MRLSRAALALLMLVTLVIGTQAGVRARQFDDDGIGAYDDLTGPPCIAATAIELPVVERTVVDVARARATVSTEPARIDILSTAPKTSPPA